MQDKEMKKQYEGAISKAKEVKEKIERYRGTKDNSVFDSFYHTDLDVMHAALDCYIKWLENDGAYKDSKLETMMGMQKELQAFLGTDFDAPMTIKERTAFTKEHSIHLNQEINEALYELPFFKPWKNYDNMTEDDICTQRAKFVEEMVDAWHFFMNMMLAWNITPGELYNGYMKKNAENYARQKRGYTHDVSYRK